MSDHTAVDEALDFMRFASVAYDNTMNDGYPLMATHAKTVADSLTRLRAENAELHLLVGRHAEIPPAPNGCNCDRCELGREYAALATKGATTDD
jgi:hypothetical protein